MLQDVYLFQVGICLRFVELKMVDNWLSRCLKTCLSISSLRKRGPKEKEKLKKKKKERRRKKEKKTNLRKK